MKKISLLALISLGLAPSLFAQAPATPNVDLVAQQQRISQLTQQLEDLRSDRDKIVVERWKNKKEANDQRESLSQQLEERKTILDQEGVRRQNLVAEFKDVRDLMEQIRIENETTRSQYMSLGIQEQRFQEFKNTLKTGVFSGTPDQIQKLNRLEKSTLILKGSPEALFSQMVTGALSEIENSRKFTLKRKEILLPNGQTTMGLQLQGGSLFAVQADEKLTQSSHLLPVFDKGERTYSWNWKLPQVQQLQTLQALATLQKSDSSIALISVDYLMSPNFDPTAPELKEKTSLEKFLEDFHKGGVFSYAIVFIGLIGLLISIERFIKWLLERNFSRTQIEQFYSLVENKEWEKAMIAAKSFKGQWKKLSQIILENRETSRDHTEKMLEQFFMNNSPLLEKRIYTISVLSAVAPLMGLLGTVFGMIEMFDAITLYGNNNPKMLADGISIALVATELGLSVAIPLQLLYNFIANRMDGLKIQIQQNALRLVNALWID
jgi:biopolymer transport protein ExbB/TolQ